MSEIYRAFLANEAALRRYIARHRITAHQIEDLLQETFLKGFAAELRSGIKEPKAYLFQVAKSLVLQLIRKNDRTGAAAPEEPADLSLILDEHQAASEQWLEARRKLALFVRAVAQLPPQCRTAFLMRRIDGLQYKQIANRMNISVSAVEKHVTAGLLKCHAYLREHGYESGQAQESVEPMQPSGKESVSNDE